MRGAARPNFHMLALSHHSASSKVVYYVVLIFRRLWHLKLDSVNQSSSTDGKYHISILIALLVQKLTESRFVIRTRNPEIEIQTSCIIIWTTKIGALSSCSFPEPREETKEQWQGSGVLF
jgi:hypothetical protein